MINAGDLKDHVSFWRPTVTTNDYGEQLTEWKEVYRCRARVQFRTGRRAIGEGEVWNPTTVVVTARYARSLGGGALTTQSGQLLAAGVFWKDVPLLMAAGLRMRWNGQEYFIDAMNEADGQATLTCTAVELSKAGE